MVGQFVRWLTKLPPGGAPIPVFENGTPGSRTLNRATSLILLGDILELWDSDNRSVHVSGIPVAITLDSLDAAKIYVLGNHDKILETRGGEYPLGPLGMSTPGLTILPDVYPPPDESGRILPLNLGGASYIFVHGHQFSWAFIHAHGLWRVLPHIRQVGVSLGSYSWLFLLWWIGASWLQFYSAPSPWGLYLVLGLPLLWFPRVYMTVARPLWKHFFGAKYNRKNAFRGFRKWWHWFRNEVGPAEDLTVVYGHTHILDWFEAGMEQNAPPDIADSERKLGEFLRTEGRPHQTLYNISSWVTSSGSHEEVVRATIFYVDKLGPLVLGWDWKSEKPFHIPKELLRERRLRKILSDESRAHYLSWPKQIITKWQGTTENVIDGRRLRTRRPQG